MPEAERRRRHKQRRRPPDDFYDWYPTYPILMSFVSFFESPLLPRMKRRMYK